MTLTDFILARIAEDEDAAKCDVKYAVQHAHLTTSPARVLAECEAKRRIVTGDRGRIGVSGYMLGVLALPYADHPDYREEWRP